MTILLLVALAAIIWLLMRIARHTADALDRQAALQVELAALNRRLSAIERRLASDAGEQDSPGG
ncbi:hypothetical protein DES49_0103 [Halospina denitrificans]|uniref:Phage shock protein B n=1 Tax=Halospina denitrificans TaxID=332522 RepID=A0A4R7K0Y4_9GAMM|nr:hypothetical protein [Halospina denitrificans]TDT44004.1 hypothetical protein DES49_0103 [Halospina denitrificans]